MKLKHKLLVKRLIIIASLAFAIILLSLLKTSIFISEYIFSRGISRAYIFFVGNISSVLPFSIFELLIASFIIVILFLIFKWGFHIRKKRNALFAKSMLNIVILTLSIVLIYSSTASFSYYRKPLPIPQYQGGNLENQDIAEIIRYYAGKFQQVSDLVERDADGRVISPYTHSELNNRMIEEYKRIGTLDGYLNSFTPRVKNIMASKFMSYQHVTGIAISPTGEANVNSYTPTNYKLLTMAHEIAHIKGVMNEDEANLLSYYLAITSEDIYFQYAGYMYTLGRLYEIAYYTMDEETYKELVDLYPVQAREERRKEHLFWDDYDSIIDRISGYMNDLYLKISGVKEGTDSYIDTSHKEIVIDPVTQEPQVIIVDYSPVQKMYIALYYAN